MLKIARRGVNRGRGESWLFVDRFLAIGFRIAKDLLRGCKKLIDSIDCNSFAN